ncbi:MAG TPA: nickel-dependent lactate racemase [Anaeromyxobacteraceae bacterium]|jgi:nickel-dependent lactate racemase|nr:nickel-dependent lactate racemase [Anaeromyxobacteraceae bacterium]
MDVELSYGRGALSVRLPDGVEATVIRKPAMPVLPDPAGAVAAALRSPVEARPLEEEARGHRSACVLVCDITRPVPNGTILPEVLRALLAAGLAPERVRVLVATGLHRPNLGAELEELIGDPWVTRTFRVENHDARDDAAHVDLGRTEAGTPVKLDRRFVEAELKLVTGLVEPHFMAGYSGGRKVIAPGVAHRETITTFHSHRFMAHPRAENCVLAGNPLHSEQLAISRLLGRVLAVNAVIDEARRLSFVNFGELAASHARAVEFVERYARVPVPRRFQTVLTSAAGYPLDKTYYQTVKGMVAPMDILAPGADLIIASECSEGMGSREYVEAQRRLIGLGADGFLRDIAAKRFADVDEWQTQMQLKPMRGARVRLFSGRLAAADRALTGVEVVESVEEAVRESVRRSGDPRVAVIPEGPYVVPVFQPAEARE